MIGAWRRLGGYQVCVPGSRVGAQTPVIGDKTAWSITLEMGAFWYRYMMFSSWFAFVIHCTDGMIDFRSAKVSVEPNKFGIGNRIAWYCTSHPHPKHDHVLSLTRHRNPKDTSIGPR